MMLALVAWSIWYALRKLTSDDAGPAVEAKGSLRVACMSSLGR